MFGDVFT